MSLQISLSFVSYFGQLKQLQTDSEMKIETIKLFQTIYLQISYL
jgi:hypothetical protein